MLHILHRQHVVSGAQCMQAGQWSGNVLDDLNPCKYWQEQQSTKKIIFESPSTCRTKCQNRYSRLLLCVCISQECLKALLTIASGLKILLSNGSTFDYVKQFPLVAERRIVTSTFSPSPVATGLSFDVHYMHQSIPSTSDRRLKYQLYNSIVCPEEVMMSMLSAQYHVTHLWKSVIGQSCTSIT